MDPHPSLAVAAPGIEPVHLADDVVNGGAGELVAEDIDRDPVVRVGKGADGPGDALDRARVREDAPRAQPRNDRLAAAGRVRDPLAGVLRVHVLAHVVHDLQTLDPWIGVEDLGHLLDHSRPGIVEHGARGVDDEDDVLAVYRDAADHGVGLTSYPALLEEAAHLVSQLLLGGQHAPLEDVLDLGELLAGGILTPNLREIAAQPGDVALFLR